MNVVWEPTSQKPTANNDEIEVIVVDHNTVDDILKLPPQYMRAGKRKRQELSSVMSSKNHIDQCEEKDFVHKKN